MEIYAPPSRLAYSSSILSSYSLSASSFVFVVVVVVLLFAPTFTPPLTAPLTAPLSVAAAEDMVSVVLVASVLAPLVRFEEAEVTSSECWGCWVWDWDWDWVEVEVEVESEAEVDLEDIFLFWLCGLVERGLKEQEGGGFEW